ncbi:MAG: hypothetical protein U5J62_00095 [Desulfurivibrio sp.]|nr:hypothetical protein [Desulfurivibrio sp.]
MQLQNGGELVVRQYWEEGGQIKFYRYGGLVGISRASVKAIKPVTAAETSLKRKSGGRSGVDASVDGDDGTLVEGEDFKEREKKLRSALWLNVDQAAREVEKIEEARNIGDQNAEQEARERLRGLDRGTE